ncbi:hypothetical protein D9756_011413 [Leucocoprinus leucothites]|uniref:Nephrocystin 3-like N-terminal domain-containing protein n=1 Tax=Leucocoprinus leucothites TaxID=201217 RepID=A0A8H5CLZ1_9AGAR|nr:hypothetical protein D9756_011413 [Leucoagaricus leucothites]
MSELAQSTNYPRSPVTKTRWLTERRRSLTSVQEVVHEGDATYQMRPESKNLLQSLEEEEDVLGSYGGVSEIEKASVDGKDGDQTAAESRDGSIPPLREVINRFQELGLGNMGMEMLSASTSHVLPGAHDFVMNNPIFLSVGSPGDESSAMRLLAENKLSGAETDSFTRDPPPCCHPGTRHTILTLVISWLMDINRKTSLLWLHGAAGVGKSAVAQTISEYCLDKPQEQWLGAALFLSRTKNQDVPTRIIPSLAYQLAVRFPAYKGIITRLLTNEPSIFDKSLHTQFTKMIIEPLSRLDSELETSHPIIMLLDGLDECRGDQAQQTLVELIGSFSAIGHALHLPFVWIITSRPEWQIVSAFSKVERLGYLWKEELPIDTFEARGDVANFLRDGFERIRTHYADAFSPKTVWPTKEQFTVIRFYASGLFVFASTVLDFVGDGEVGDPVLQLDLCLEFFKGTHLSPAGNPLDPLESLYSGILGSIHHKALPTTLQILSVLRFSKAAFSAQTIANFLGLNQATFYGSLRRLYSVLVIPQPQDAGRTSLQIRHASFEGFLDGMLESRALGPSLCDINANICKACIRWLGFRGKMLRHARTIGPRAGYLSDNVPWNHPRSFRSIVTFTGKEIWPLLLYRAENDMVRLYQDLVHFDFASYDRVYSLYEPTHTLERHSAHAASIFCGLYFFQEKNQPLAENLIRLTPQSTTDYHLVEQYACFLKENGLRKADFKRIQSASQQFSFLCLSDTTVPGRRRIRETRKALLDPFAMYFLLGHGSKTCLIIAYRPNISVKQFLTDAFQAIHIAYSGRLPVEGVVWPLPQHVDLIASTSVLPPSSDSHSPEKELSLYSSMIRLIIAFIADTQHSNPVGRLGWIVEVLSKNYLTRSRIFNLVRKQILDDIPDHNSPLINRILSLLMQYITQGYDWSAPVLIEDLAETFMVDCDSVEGVLKTINLLISSRPLLFPLGSVLDFGFSDVPVYTLPSEVHYPWCHINTSGR